MAASNTSIDLLAGKETKPPVIIDMKDLYTLYYRKGQNPYPMSKNFVCRATSADTQKNLLKAIEASRDHCNNITARFIRCVPLISDLSLDEQKHLENEG